MSDTLCPFCGYEPEIIPALVETWARCPNKDCYIGGVMMYLKVWNRRHFKISANFLWPVEKGSVEEAGYEFANAKTEAYQFEWWKTLLIRVKEIELIKEPT